MRSSLIGVIVVLVVAGCGSSGRVSDPHRAVLRAGDLPRGYREGDNTGCGRVAGVENGSARFNAMLAAEKPDVCIIDIDRLWQADVGPPSVTSAAWLFRNARGVERGLRERQDVLNFTTAFTPRTSTRIALGDGGELLHGQGLNHPASTAVWRWRNVLAILVVEPAADRSALALARKQQAHIVGRSLPKVAKVDPLLALDDPALKLPVYWLGRSFDPTGPLPRITLGIARALENGPGNTVELDYGRPHRVTEVTLYLWEPTVWRQFVRTRLGRLIWDSPCARKTTVTLASGRADIYQGHSATVPLKPPCPRRPYDAVVAHVYLPGDVVAVNMQLCYMCIGAPRTPYESVEGMTAIARGLKLRR